MSTPHNSPQGPEYGHTPGPWFVNGPWHIQSATQTEIPVVVASIVKLRNESNHEMEANAALIALAPDLLRERDALRAQLAAERAVKAEFVKALGDCADELMAAEHAMLGPEFAAMRYNVRKRAQKARAALYRAKEVAP